MLTSILLKKIINKIVDEHPVFFLDDCINNIPNNFSCSICMDTCNEHVFLNDKIQFDKCTNCNFCSVACPTQSIDPSRFYIQQIISNIENKKTKIYVTCKKTCELGDINIYCFASLPWEIYVLLSINKNIIMSLSKCKKCEHLPKVGSLINKVKEIMGDDFVQERFLFLDEDSSEKVISRRQMFKILNEHGQQTTKYIVFDTNTSNTESLIYRKYLYKKIKSMENTNVKLFWKIPIINKNCWGCGLCTYICPNYAMKMVKQENGELSLIHIPWRCTQCGICKQTCPENAISEWSTIKKYSIEQQIVADIKIKYCPQCNNPMKLIDNNYFCYYCGYKYKNTIL